MGDSSSVIIGNEFKQLTAARRPLLWLREPRDYNSALAWGNLAYQMQYSVETLEAQLAEEGRCHVLQLNLDWEGENWRNPSYWRLFADGAEVASGDGGFARECFEASAEAFRDVCREAVLAAALPALSADEYRVLRLARAIAAAEPFNNGAVARGGRSHRAY